MTRAVGGPAPGLRLLAVGAAVLVALVLAVPVARAYRTSADGDDPELRGELPARWAGPSIRFEIHESVPSDLDRNRVEQELRLAFDSWSQPDCTTLSFEFVGWTREAPRDDDGIVTVVFVGEGWPADPTASATTDLFTVRDEHGAWRIADATIYIDAEHFRWTTEPGGSGRDLRGTAMHEVGHVIGLLHSPCEIVATPTVPACSGDEPAGVMYPTYVSPEVMRALDVDAVQGLCALYPVEECPTTCPLGWSCESGVCVDPCSGGGCGSPGAFGDPCETAADCLSALCSSDGFCTAACSDRSPCAGDLSCSAPAGEVGECVAAGSRYGETCATGEDCASGLCLEGATPAPTCTRACDAAAACPATDVCGRVDERWVCHRPLHETGCAVGGASARGASPMTALLLLAGALGACRTRRRLR